MNCLLDGEAYDPMTLGNLRNGIPIGLPQDLDDLFITVTALLHAYRL